MTGRQAIVVALAPLGPFVAVRPAAAGGRFSPLVAGTCYIPL